MAQRREIITVDAAGIMQGVELVTFPATSGLFTSSANDGLTNTEYGGNDFVAKAELSPEIELDGAKCAQ